jgi:DNA-binding beta-propeller fold protein YncE
MLRIIYPWEGIYVKNQSLFLFVLLLLAAGFGCSDDCPTCPKEEERKPYRGWLYYTESHSGLYSLYKVDLETDSIVDSMKHEDGALYTISAAVSSDGRYLAVWYSDVMSTRGSTRLYNAQTLGLVGELPEAISAYFDTEDQWLVGLDSYGTGYRISRLSLPSLTAISADSVANFRPKIIDPSRNLLYGVADQFGFASVVYPWGFYSYNYVTQELKSLPLLWSATDTIKDVYTFSLSSNGGILYFTGAEPARATVWGSIAGAFDLNSRTLLWYYPLVTSTGGIAVSPDGKEVWVTDPGPPGFEWNSGTIFILDAATGRYLQGISMFGYLPDSNPYYPLPGRGIAFAPTGDRAYVQARHTFTNPYGTVVVVDTKKRAIVKLLRPDMHSGPGKLLICPKT